MPSLPHIDWKTYIISGHNYPVSMDQLFLEIFSDIGCKHIVDFPTRIDSTLDIFITNRPSLIERCVSLLGINRACGFLCSPSTQEAIEEESLPLKEGKKVSHGRGLGQVHLHQGFLHFHPVNVFLNGFRERDAMSLLILLFLPNRRRRGNS